RRGWAASPRAASAVSTRRVVSGESVGAATPGASVPPELLAAAGVDDPEVPSPDEPDEPDPPVTAVPGAPSAGRSVSDGEALAASATRAGPPSRSAPASSLDSI
ncbi:MAG TPA: hypothetical protein VNP37_08645, partial [Actinomycetospora sp.]|nr:hypothetical protein [Actinomycetospora sp.]